MTFSELTKSDKSILIQFTASWCGPCQAMKPVLEKLKSNMGEAIRIIKIDIDKNPTLAQEMSIQGVPTFLVYRNGDLLWRQSGMQSISDLENAISLGK